MELRVLKYFITVAREESISAAADYLHMTQPTLSRQLKDLENELGKQLLIRGNRRITLTDDGILFRKRAEEIIDLVNKTEAEMTSDNETISGDIYIGGGESASMRLIMRVIARMQKMHPKIQFHLFSGNAQDVADKLESGLLDFGIFFDPVNLSQYDYFTLPGKEVMGVLMRKDDPLSQYDAITPDMLRNQPIILSDQDIVKNEIAGWIGGNERKLNIKVTYNLIHNSALLVEEGGGYALTFNNIISTDENSLLCFKPLSPQLEDGIHIAWKKYHLFSKQAERFLELLKEEIS